MGTRCGMNKVKGYSQLYMKLFKTYRTHNKKNKLRLIHKHSNMAINKAIKEYPGMRKMERGKKVFTYQTMDEVYFTCRPKQKDCSNLTLYKAILITGNRR